jgi:hypothetical protein
MAKLSNDSRFKRLSNQYRLVIMNDDTYEEMVTFKLSRLSVYIGFSTVFVALISVTMALVIFTPLKYYIPGYGSRQSRTELDLLKIRTDSLEQTILYKEQYLEAVKKVLNGTTPTQRDTLGIPVPKQEISKD